VNTADFIDGWQLNIDCCPYIVLCVTLALFVRFITCLLKAYETRFYVWRYRRFGTRFCGLFVPFRIEELDDHARWPTRPRVGDGIR